jgi:hypothetical protein
MVQRKPSKLPVLCHSRATATVLDEGKAAATRELAVRVICCLRLVVMAVIALAQASCGTKCGIADSVTVLDVHGGIYLVYRVSGVQKKIEFFEVYRDKPVFDSCGSPQTPMIAQEPYLRSLGFLKKVELHGERLEVIYTQNAQEAIKPRDARLPR